MGVVSVPVFVSWQSKSQNFLHLALQNPSSSWNLDLVVNVAPLSVADEDGRLPLHYAAMNG
jgi:ankyrin repeat protein